MSVNKFQPHVYVLPEDDADRQIANGFLLGPSLLDNRIRILEEAGGWNEVIERFCSTYAAEMDRYPDRHMVLVIDFDGKPDRFEVVRKRIPQHLLDRVFVLGALNDPENLRQELRLSYEAIGTAMARDCCGNTASIWEHRLLSHNTSEIDRLRTTVCPILFRSA